MPNEEEGDIIVNSSEESLDDVIDSDENVDEEVGTEVGTDEIDGDEPEFCMLIIASKGFDDILKEIRELKE